MYHSQVNLYRRLASIYAYLRGTKSSPAAEELFPGSSLGVSMDERIKKEQASRQEVEEWFKIPNFWRG